MKATISAQGTLKVTPETEVESYALRCWWIQYCDLKDPTRAVLSVEDIRIDTPAETEEPK